VSRDLQKMAEDGRDIREEMAEDGERGGFRLTRR